jgi:hypothetical protein
MQTKKYYFAPRDKESPKNFVGKINGPKKGIFTKIRT